MTVLSSLTPNNLTYWQDTDTAERFNKNWNSTRTELVKNGYQLDTVIEYQTDHYGLRNKPCTKISGSILGLGCSYTFGTGLDVVDTWLYQLGELLGESTYNAGIPGSSNDTAFRLANYLIPKYKPKAVFLLSTYRHRYEFYHEDEYHNYGPHFKPGIFAEKNIEFFNDTHNVLNTKKNILAIKCLCLDANIEFNYVILEDEILPAPGGCWARDLSHFGRKTQMVVANKMKIA